MALPFYRLSCFITYKGWTPLCNFLGLPIPEGSYPRLIIQQVLNFTKNSYANPFLSEWMMPLQSQAWSVFSSSLVQLWNNSLKCLSCWSMVFDLVLQFPSLTVKGEQAVVGQLHHILLPSHCYCSCCWMLLQVFLSLHTFLQFLSLGNKLFLL